MEALGNTEYRSLPSLPGPLRSRGVASGRVLSMAQKLFEILRECKHMTIV